MANRKHRSSALLGAVLATFACDVQDGSTLENRRARRDA